MKMILVIVSGLILVSCASTRGVPTEQLPDPSFYNGTFEPSRLRN